MRTQSPSTLAWHVGVLTGNVNHKVKCPTPLWFSDYVSQVTESAGGENYYIYDLLKCQILWISFPDCQGYNWNRSCPAFHALNLYLFMVTTQYWHNSCDFYLCCYPSLLTFMKARNLTSWLISSYSSWHIGMLNTYQLKSMSIILTYVKGLCYSDKWIFNGLFYVGFTLVHDELYKHSAKIYPCPLSIARS